MPPLITLLLVLLGIVLFFLAFSALLLSLRGTLTIAYKEEFSIYAKIFFIKIPIFPRKERKKRKLKRMSARKAARIRKRVEARKKYSAKNLIAQIIQKIRDSFSSKDTKKAEDAPKKSVQKSETLPVKLTVSDAIDIVTIITELVGAVVKRFTKHLRVKVARFNIKVASENAALTAVAYGSISQIINILLPILYTVENFTVPKEKDFSVVADFVSDKPEVDVEFSFSLRTWHILDICFSSIWGSAPKIIQKYTEISNRSKKNNHRPPQKKQTSKKRK